MLMFTLIQTWAWQITPIIAKLPQLHPSKKVEIAENTPNSQALKEKANTSNHVPK